MSADTFRKLHR